MKSIFGRPTFKVLLKASDLLRQYKLIMKGSARRKSAIFRSIFQKESKNGIFYLLFQKKCLRCRKFSQIKTRAYIMFWDCSENQFDPPKKSSTNLKEKKRQEEYAGTQENGAHSLSFQPSFSTTPVQLITAELKTKLTMTLLASRLHSPTTAVQFLFSASPPLGRNQGGDGVVLWEYWPCRICGTTGRTRRCRQASSRLDVRSESP